MLYVSQEDCSEAYVYIRRHDTSKHFSSKRRKQTKDLMRILLGVLDGEEESLETLNWAVHEDIGGNIHVKNRDTAEVDCLLHEEACVFAIDLLEELKQAYG